MRIKLYERDTMPGLESDMNKFIEEVESGGGGIVSVSLSVPMSTFDDGVKIRSITYFNAAVLYELNSMTNVK